MLECSVAKVEQSTSRRLSRALETAEVVHLCLVGGCSEGERMHVSCFAIVDTGTKVDVHNVADTGGLRWGLSRGARFIMQALVHRPVRCARACFGCLCGSCCCRRRKQHWHRSPDSESEADEPNKVC